MKNFFLGIITVLLIGLIAFGAYQLGTKKQNAKPIEATIPQTTGTPPGEITPTTEIFPTITLTPTSETASDDELITKALFDKNNWGQNASITVVVKTNDKTYASGSVNSENGGGYFFAAKINGEWKIIADGNGVITCASLTNYPNYPKTLIPECYDETIQDTVKR